MLIDSHCHLTDEKFTDVKETLNKARESGVENVIIPSTSLMDAKRAVVIATQEKQFCLVGIHPEEVENLHKMVDGWSEIASVRDTKTRNDEAVVNKIMEEMEKIIDSSERVVGVGEIGLDYYWDKEKKTEKIQKEIFRKQLDLAARRKLPVAIHMRNAEEEMKEELEIFISGQNNTLRGQFHCFAGSSEFLKMILKMGFYVSFCGNITYKSAGNLRDLLKEVPLNRLLLETDSPYLSPEPLRGTVNGPANVKITAEFIASELNIDYQELVEITSQNTICLYSLDI